MSTAKTDPRVASALAALEAHASPAHRAGLARFAIPSDDALGVPMKHVQAIAKGLGRDHALAAALWKTGVYEARLLAAYVDEPARVTPAQMERWCRDFRDWATCDTVAFLLFDKTAHAWDKVAAWADRAAEFEKRAAFALLAGLALHDRRCPDAKFRAALPLIEAAAADPRNFVKKAVSWALRGIGARNAALNKSALALAKRLAASADRGERWVGKDAVKGLTSPATARRIAKRAA